VELVDQELEAALTNGSEPITGDSDLKPISIVIDDGAWFARLVSSQPLACILLEGAIPI
jgi:hypothetical protein